MENLFTVSLNETKIILTPEERLSKEYFKAFRHFGWLWARSLNAFVFNKNEEGAKRVKRLEDKSIINSLSQYYYSKEDIETIKNEILETSIEYDTEETKEFINNLQNERLAKIEKEKEEKKRKEEHADEEREKRLKKILVQLKTLKNGFGCDMYDLAMSNCNLSDLLVRGVRVNYSIKELAKKFNYDDNENLIKDNDILELSIRYGNNWSRYYGDKPESRYLSFEVDHFTKSDTTIFMSGGSGHFRLATTILNNEKRINFKNVAKVSELITDDVLKICFNQYMAFVKGEIPFKQNVNSFGMITEKTVNNDCLDFLKNQFLGVAA